MAEIIQEKYSRDDVDFTFIEWENEGVTYYAWQAVVPDRIGREWGQNLMGVQTSFVTPEIKKAMKRLAKAMFRAVPEFTYEPYEDFDA